MMDPRILHAPASDRNKAPILEVLRAVLPAQGTVLEIASGTGQHVVHFAAELSRLTWQPSDPDPRHRESIAARVAESGLSNVHAPLDIDVLAPWPALTADAVIVANLLHISDPATMPALCHGAADLLGTGGMLHVYGPFNRHGTFTSEGNARFHASLQQQNPAWGIRDVEALVAVAEGAGLALREIREMPANNLSVLFDRQ